MTEHTFIYTATPNTHTHTHTRLYTEWDAGYSLSIAGFNRRRRLTRSRTSPLNGPVGRVGLAGQADVALEGSRALLLSLSLALYLSIYLFALLFFFFRSLFSYREEITIAAKPYTCLSS